MLVPFDQAASCSLIQVLTSEGLKQMYIEAWL